MAAIGIDLGTANARVAIFKWDKPQLVDDAGAASIPAVVSLDPKGARVGQAALKRAWSHAETTARGAKRVLGRSIDDPVVKAYGRNAPVAPDAGARLCLGVHGKAGAPEAAAAILVAHLAKIAAEKLGSWPTSAVLCAPAWFGAVHRAALRLVAQEAGLAVSRVVSEPVAAAVQLVVPGGPERRIAVIDIGAGGIGAAVLVTGRAQLRIAGEAGDGVIAGDDFDGLLITSAIEQLTAQIGPIVPMPATLEMLRQTCEEMKIELSSAGSVTRVIPFIPNPVRGGPPPSLTFSRAQIEPLLGDLVEGAVACFRRALAVAQIEASALDAVFFNGGMMQLAGLQAALQSAIGHRGAPGLDPKAAPALGAALLGASLARQIGPILFEDGPIPVEMRQRTPAVAIAPGPPDAPSSPESAPAIAPPAAPDPLPPPVSQPAREPTLMPAPEARPASAAPSVRIETVSPSRRAPPLSSSSALVPREVGNGTIDNPRTPRAVVALALARPIVDEDLEPIALPVLLVRLLGRKHVTGTLTVTEGKRAFSIMVVEGMGYLRAQEHPSLHHLFGWPKATYSFNPAPPDPGRREKFTMDRLAMDGLRVLGRSFSEADMEEALGPNVHLSPRLIAERALTIKRLVSDSQENRFIEFTFDGRQTARELAIASGVPHTTLRLLLLLSAFDVLEWRAVVR